MLNQPARAMGTEVDRAIIEVSDNQEEWASESAGGRCSVPSVGLVGSIVSDNDYYRDANALTE
jgi:hypothetical protein